MLECPTFFINQIGNLMIIKIFCYFCSVKLTASILSLLLLLLSCLPCADGINNSVANKQANFADNHTNHDTDKHTDSCSPFCICNCCGVQVLNFTPTLLFYPAETVTAFIAKPQIVYKSHLASMFSGSIWQPPQIV